MFGITQQHGRNVIAIEARRERQDTTIGIQRVLFQKVIPHAAFAHDEPLTRHLAVLAQNPVTARDQGRFNPGKIRRQEAFEFDRPDAMQLRCTVVPILRCKLLMSATALSAARPEASRRTSGAA
jgi:hypothetical protein